MPSVHEPGTLCHYVNISITAGILGGAPLTRRWDSNSCVSFPGLSPYFSPQPYKVGFHVPLCRRGSMLREVRQLAQGHTAVNFRDSSLGLSVPELSVFPLQNGGVACFLPLATPPPPSPVPIPDSPPLSSALLRETALGQDCRWRSLCPLEPYSHRSATVSRNWASSPRQAFPPRLPQPSRQA